MLALSVAGGLLVVTSASRAQTQVFSENFEIDHSNDGTWVTNSVGGYNPANLYFDYSSVGIPSAPHSAGGSTYGLKLQANLDPAVQIFPSGSSVSPTGFSITENFEMRWDWWLNFNGSPTTGLTGGGSGSTQIGVLGLELRPLRPKCQQLLIRFLSAAVGTGRERRPTIGFTLLRSRPVCRIRAAFMRRALLGRVTTRMPTINQPSRPYPPQTPALPSSPFILERSLD